MHQFVLRPQLHKPNVPQRLLGSQPLLQGLHESSAKTLRSLGALELELNWEDNISLDDVAYGIAMILRLEGSVASHQFKNGNPKGP